VGEEKKRSEDRGPKFPHLPILVDPEIIIQRHYPELTTALLLG